jgi:PAS domain S-box-containing protein
MLVHSVFDAEGFDCEIVNVDSREAFEAALERQTFDLIISDYALPSFDGVAALSLTREKNPDIPFVFVSGTMGEELAIETLKAGATDYVLKERLTRLVPSVRRALAEARERQDRQASDAALRESEERYRSIVETTNDWIWSVDLDGRMTYSNPAVESILGYTADELAGKFAFDHIAAEDRARAREILAECCSAKRGWTGIVLRWRHKDGSLRHLESNGVPLFGPDGELVGYRGARRDITERLQLEAQLRHSQKMEAIGTLAGGIAHDFNNLLTSILGYSDLILQSVDLESSLRPDVEEIKRSGERAAALTRQLLAFSRKQVLQPVVLDVNAVVRDVEKMLRRLIGEDLDFAVTLDPAIARVRADPGQVEQVIVNLVVNARDAMPRGGKLTIETRDCEIGEMQAMNDPGLQPGSFVCLSVSDTGTGMNAETVSHIFEPFFTTKEKGKGTGLGLSTVYGIARQSGGHVAVYSEPGKGTTFKTFFPQVSEKGERADPRSAPVSSGGSETVLIVEDERPVRALGRRSLEGNGYTVLEAGSVEDALSLCANYSGEIDLVVTDTVMPGASGPELARELSRLRPATRVLFVSGYADNAVVRNGLLTANLAFLQKPFSPAALSRKVREVLDGAAPVQESLAS